MPPGLLVEFFRPLCCVSGNREGLTGLNLNLSTLRSPDRFAPDFDDVLSAGGSLECAP